VKRFDVALVCGLFVPGEGFAKILLNAFTGLVHASNAVLGLGEPCFG